MPTKTLPDQPNLVHLKNQASDLIRDLASQNPEAAQRIREFHPRFHQASDSVIFEASFKRSDAYLTLAREYGFPSWPRIKAVVMQRETLDLSLPLHERIKEPNFRTAVDLMDQGAVDELKAHLSNHPDVVRARVKFEGGNYFQNPSLLEFCAENPVRHGKLPSNIVQVARTILDAGAKDDRVAIDATLGLVATGKVARECLVQGPLLELLCDYGADPNGALNGALVHGEFAAVSVLLQRGAKIALSVAAALGRTDDVRQLLSDSGPSERHLALALACQFGHEASVRLLLHSGEDPNRFNPLGAHAHSTPLHQAAIGGHLDVVMTMIEFGARWDIKDILWHGTAVDWAKHAGIESIIAYFEQL